VGGRIVKITADTNILARAIAGDDPQQSPLAKVELADATLVALTLPALCELAWVLRHAYRANSEEIAQAITRLCNADNVTVDRPAVDAGLALLAAGADFADGVIAHAGRWLGAETFVSFDITAVRLLRDRGDAARIPA
jgi:predicted nucleic-acid-binding protein